MISCIQFISIEIRLERTNKKKKNEKENKSYKEDADTITSFICFNVQNIHFSCMYIYKDLLTTLNGQKKKLIATK